MRFQFLFSVATLLALSFAAHADTTYTYTGQNFTSATGAFTTSDSVTGSFVLATPLAANLSNSSITPLSFSFSDGVDTFTNSNTGFATFAFSTDGSGAIDSYEIDLVAPGQTANIIVIPGLDLGGSFKGGGGTGSTFSSGTFTVSTSTTAATPEPSSLVLLGTGLLGAVRMIRRRVA